MSSHSRVAAAIALLTVVAARSSAQENEVQVVTSGGHRYVVSNGIPDHVPGQFPNRNNPNRIAEQDHRYRMPLAPVVAERATPNRGQFGVAIDGIPFDPGTGETWRGDVRWRYEALGGGVDLGIDSHHAHVQPTGLYHYHGLPTALVRRTGADHQMGLLGWAADGFEIYGPACLADPEDPESRTARVRSGWVLRKGQRPGGSEGPGGRYDGTFTQDWTWSEDAGDLDECNGHSGATPTHLEGAYHYHVLAEFPFVPRYWRGTPDESFTSLAPHAGGGGHRHPPRRE